MRLQPKATAVGREPPGPLPAPGGRARPSPWVGRGTCPEQRGFPPELSRACGLPVPEVWFSFAESCFPQTAPHPPRPGASEGLSPTLSWQPLGRLCVPPLTPTSGTGTGAEPAQTPSPHL